MDVFFCHCCIHYEVSCGIKTSLSKHMAGWFERQTCNGNGHFYEWDILCPGRGEGSQQAFCLENRLPLSSINSRIYSVEAHWPRCRFSLLPSIFFFFKFPTRRNDFKFTLQLFPHADLFKEDLWIFNQLFWESRKGIFHLVSATSPMSNSSCFLCKTHAADISRYDGFFFLPQLNIRAIEVRC